MGTGFPLLEREQELARVSELVDACASREFRLAVVEGSAGAGKSAILNGLSVYADACEIRVLRATGLELEGEYPFGMTNRRIAETLFVTRKTVESHLDHVFHKLGIHARGELERALAAEEELTPVG